MEPSALHSQVAVFEEEDNCLYFILGLAHATSQIMTWLEAETASVVGEVDPFSPQPGGSGKQVNDVADFLLGLISFSQHYDHSLAANLADSLQDGSPKSPESARMLERLVIRDLLV